MPTVTRKKAPTTEQGSVRQGGFATESWASYVDDGEKALPLKWPQSVRETYPNMRNDAQVDALFRGTTLPVRRYRYSIDPNGANSKLVTQVAEDLNLPIVGQKGRKQGRRKRRFSFPLHLKWALDAMGDGHAFFEQVGEYDADDYWRLRKLAPRPAKTILNIRTSPDGGLQEIEVPSNRQGVMSEKLPVDHLVAYIWDQAPGSWIGRSMFRSIYRNYLLKDRLLRIDVTLHQRAGGGTPLGKGAPGMTKPQLEALARMAKAFRTNEDGGGAIPHGAELDLMGVKGSIPDAWKSIRGHNEEMARAWMSEVVQLGSTASGSRALGEVHLSLLNEFQESIAGWFCDTFNEHVIEDIVDWNYGEDEPSPLLVWERPPNDALAVADLKTLIDVKAIEVDEELENWVRDQFKLPTRSTPRMDPVRKPDDAPGEETGGAPASPETVSAETRRRRGQVSAAESPSLPLPDRTLRRQPYEHEVIAAVDFKQLDQEYTSALDSIVDTVTAAQAAQVEELKAAIVAADGDLADLSMLMPTPTSSDDIFATMKQAAEDGKASAIREAEAQGKKNVVVPDIDEDQLAKRAEAVSQLLARSLGEVAGRKALEGTAASVEAATVADNVAAHIDGLTDKYLRDQLGGAVQQGINTGRKAVIGANEPRSIYASELMDGSTCSACVSIDGTTFTDLVEAEGAYPTGGYADCQGGPRCRGTLVAVYDEAPASLEM